MKNTDNSQYAVKIVNKQKLNELEKDMHRNEISVVNIISHPSIIKYYEVIQSMTQIYFISEYVPYGELAMYVEKNGKLTEDQAGVVLYYLLNAIKYLHDNGIVHRDLKPENVLLELNEKRQIKNVKLIDFGLSKVILHNELMLEQCGTLTYIAPEILQKYGYSKEIDLWSLGIMLYFMYFYNFTLPKVNRHIAL